MRACFGQRRRRFLTFFLAFAREIVYTCVASIGIKLEEWVLARSLFVAGHDERSVLLLNEGDDGCGGKTLAGAVAETVERLGYECVRVAMKTDSSQQRLQVLIDSLGGIGISDCERVSRAVNRLLDEKDFPGLEGRYYLEVSSPGVERPLFTPEHYGRFRGKEARVHLGEPVAGRRTLTGRIVSADEAFILIHQRKVVV